MLLVKYFNSSKDAITFLFSNFHSKSNQKRYENGFVIFGKLSIFDKLTLFVANAQRHLYKLAGIFLASNNTLILFSFLLYLIFESFLTITTNLVVFPF
jgi:hypothetical protein